MGIRDFIKSLPPAPGKSAGLDADQSASSQDDLFAQPLKADVPNQPKGPGDSGGWTVVGLPYVSADGGKTPVADPGLDVEYDLCVKIANQGKGNAPSGPFVVEFIVAGTYRFQKTFQADAGLAAGSSLVGDLHA